MSDILENHICKECNLAINYKLKSFGVDTEDNLCKKCYEKRLVKTNCKDTKKILCNGNCLTCYSRSMLSSDKLEYVNLDEVKKLELPLPRHIHMKSRKNYPFKGSCGHKFCVQLKGVARGFWCNDQQCINKKLKETNMRLRGVEHPSQSEDIKKQKIQTNLEKRGVENPFQCEEVKKKIRATNMKNLGVESPMHNSNIVHKVMIANHAHKEHELPSGNIVNVQGYEPWAIDFLLQTYTEDDIQTVSDHKLAIDYIGIDNKKHKYIPDLYIKSKNLIIEVKSDYTYKVDLQTNNLKAQSCISAEYDFKFYVFDKKKKLTIIDIKTRQEETLILDLPVKSKIIKDENDLSLKTVKELIIMCKEKEISGYSKKRKADIIKLIEQSS